VKKPRAKTKTYCRTKTKIQITYKGDIVWDGIRLGKVVGRQVGRL
jgi:hypothetical protein